LFFARTALRSDRVCFVSGT